MANSLLGLAGDQAVAIAQADAARVYRNLSLYRIQLVLEDDGWHVDYELKDPQFTGGGPHYVIDAHIGAFVAKRYEQQVQQTRRCRPHGRGSLSSHHEPQDSTGIPFAKSGKLAP